VSTIYFTLQVSLQIIGCFDHG